MKPCPYCAEQIQDAAMKCRFCGSMLDGSTPAAHTGIHDGAFEPLHGHSFTVTLCLHGDLDSAGMLVDFSIVKRELAAVIAPLRRRTLRPARC